MRRADGSLMSEAGGDVSLSDGSHLQYVITSERYKQWDAARDGLSKSVVARFGALLKPKAPTQQTIARATAFLENDPQARQSIARTGMSVKDFVLMTVSLEQEMQLASARGQPKASAAPYPMDSAYTLPSVPSAQMPMSPSYDTATHVDSGVRPLPSPRVDTTYRRDSVIPAPELKPVPKPDSISPKRDSVSPPPTPPDGVTHDSLPAALT
jgi:hypothetical protein